MSSAKPQQPEPSGDSQSPEADAGLLDLTWRDAGEEPLASESESEKQQSLFSARSGIQDLLTRPEGAAPEPAVELMLGTETQDREDEDEETVEAEPAPSPERRRRRGMPKPGRSRRQQDRVRRRQMNYLEKRREQKRRMVFYNRVRLVFKLCFALLWGTLLWELLHSGLWTFSNPDFQLENQHLLQAAQVAPLVNHWVGKPIYAVDTGKLAADIKRDFDVVDKVAVRRRLFPARLEVMVSEKQPWAEIYTDEKQPKPYGLLVPKGVVSLANYANYQPGMLSSGSQAPDRIIVAPQTPLTRDFLSRLQEIDWQAQQVPGLHLASVDIRNPALVVLNYQEAPVILGHLDNAVAARLSRLIPLVPKIQELKTGIAAVDLRWGEQVTIHTKPNAALGLKPPKTDG